MRWVSWAAVSSLPQARKVSLDEQLKINREHADRHGGHIVAELVVPGESRNIILFEDACRRIEAYAALRDMIAERAFDVLVFLDRSRLGRKASLSMAVVELCHEAGIITYETENPPTTLEAPQTGHDDMLLGAIKSVGAQREIQKLQERHAMGMVGRIRRGELPASPPYGYAARYDDQGKRHIEVNEDAARWVRQIAEWYLDGAGTVTIANRLNAAGVPTPTGSVWQDVHVRSVLFRAWRYAGYGEINRLSAKRAYVRAKGNWPAILAEDVAERIFEERAARNQNRKIPDTHHLLAGLVFCRRCGRALRTNSTKRNRKTRQTQLQMYCPNKHEHRFISYQRVVDALRTAIEYLSAQADLSALLADDTGAATQWEAQITAREGAIDRILAALHRADDAFVSGAMDKERYQRQVERLDAQMQAEQDEIERLRGLLTEERRRGQRMDRLQEVASAGLAMLDDADKTRSNAWLRRHLRIWVEEHRVVEVEYL